MFLVTSGSRALRLAAAFVFGTAVFAGSTVAQVALGSGTYTQTFDSIGSGLPAGWSVYTAATASSLGTVATLNTTAVAWSSSTGQWANYASATGFTGTEAAAVQAAATNRALAIRQTGAVGDPGASANFFFSTIGQQVTSVSFTAQMLSVQARSTVWSLQYGLGATPASWTTIATYSDPGVFGSTTITGSGFGTALDNQGNVWLRIVALTASTGASSRDTFGIENFTIATSATSSDIAPSIDTPPSPQTVTEGDTVHFTVGASGTAPLSYHWRKNTNPLSDVGNVTGSLTATLTLAGVAVTDGGSYDVVVTNNGGSATSPAASLVVNPLVQPPTITAQPASQSVAVGGTASFTVGVGGTAPFSFQWRQGGLPLADGGKISGATTQRLTIAGVTADDAGIFDVVVSNAANPSATSNTAALSVAAIVTPTGQIAYAGGTYAQGFDSLPSTGTFTLASAGPLGLDAAPISASGLGGWSLAKYGGSGTLALFKVDNGSGNSGSIYSYGATAATDRALGSLASGTTISRFGATFVNSTGQTITQFTLAYTGEQWRRGTGAANRLTFDYAFDPTNLNTGAFTAVPALDVVAPVTTGSSVALDGNAAANHVAIGSTVTGLNWAPGQVLVLRWTDVDDTGSDDGLAIDNLSFSTPVAAGAILPGVVYTSPANGSVNVPTSTALSVTFNEAVNFTNGSFTLTGATSGVHTATVTGGPVSYTLTPDTAFAEGEAVTFAVLAAQVTDAATGTEHPAADTTTGFITFSSSPLAIHTVQGSGLTSPYVGNSVTVSGVVVASFQGAGGLGGYYIEAPDAQQDADPATSEGIFVFDNVNSVTTGDLVTVSGAVAEFGTAPATETEITALTGFTKVSSGNPLPTATAVSLPFPSASYAERYEGMLVTLPQTLTVTDNFDLGTFGELLISNGRLATPTNVVAPGAPAQALEASNLLNQLVLDDGSSTSFPDPTPFLNGLDPTTATRRTGSTAAGITGILDNKFGVYVIEATATPTFVEANPRLNSPASTGSMRVAIGNIENFMNGDGQGGGFPTSRGATTFAEYERQLPKVTAAILNLAPDIMGLTEVENDRVTNGDPDSYGPTSAIAELVASLNANAAPGVSYAFVNAAAVDITTDQIHCAFIYRVEKVEMVGLPAMLDDPSFNDQARNPLAQTFREKATGAKLTVCINHFRAKGSAAAGPGNTDIGDGQGTNNALRVQEADALTAWLATDPTGSGDPDFLIIGDLNSYAKEDPITHILNAGYISQTERFEGEGGYSYSFNGEFGHLDHSLASPSLSAQVFSAATWHVNADEPTYYDYNVENKSAAQQAINAGTPYRYSDHDPVVIGVYLTAAPTITTQPVPQTVTVGNSVTFSVAAIGYPTPTYQWRKGGTPISGATGSSYTIGFPLTADAGSYDVVVSNSAGSVTSTAVTLTVNKAVATVMLSNFNTVYNGTPQGATITTNPAGLGLVVTYNGSGTIPTNAGTYAISATVVDDNYTGSATGSLVIAKAGATVLLGNLSQTYDGNPKTASATTTPAGLAVALTYNGSATPPTNVGSYAVAAVVTDANYSGSTNGTLSISPASATIALAGLVQPYDGTPRSVTVTTTPPGVTYAVTYNGNTTAPTNPGTYAVAVTITDPNYTGSASGSLVITVTALLRHAPTLNGGVDGSIQMLTGENAVLNSTAWVSGDLLAPGTPTVVLNGNPTYGGTIDGGGASSLFPYTITLNGGSVLRHVVRKTNPLAMPVVAAPPAPTGTRGVILGTPGQSPGSFATVRDLTLNGSYGNLAVPAGSYGAFTANGSNRFILGVAGATSPAVYNLQSLVLNGSSQLVIVGPVTLTMASAVTANGSIGTAAHPEWLTLRLAAGGLTLNGKVTVAAYVTAPSGTITINGGTTLTGGVTCDRLVINSTGTLIDPAL